MKKYQRKDNYLKIRISEKDLNRVRTYAEMSNMCFSEFVREAVLRYVPKKMGSTKAAHLTKGD